MGSRTFPSYAAISSFDEKDAVHAFLLDAQRRGAIKIEWDRAAGQQNQIKRLILADGEALGAVMMRTPAWEHLRVAEERLGAWVIECPTVDRFLTAWRRGRAVRSIAAADLSQVEDALAVLRYLRQHPATDFSLRTVSVALFSDSKRLERLRSCLDVLTSTDPAIPRHRDEIFAELGLLRAPQPMLLAGPVSITTTAGEVSLIEPYIGFAPNSVIGLVEDELQYVLTVENLASFYELARGSGGALRGLVIYTGGMPSPGWRAAYAALVAETSSSCPIFHWGDTDPGGFRIALALSQVLSSLSRQLRPHLMDPIDLARQGARGRDGAVTQISEMASIARRLGWSDIATAIESCGLLVEQEAAVPALPAASEYDTKHRKPTVTP